MDDGALRASVDGARVDLVASASDARVVSLGAPVATTDAPLAPPDRPVVVGAVTLSIDAATAEVREDEFANAIFRLAGVGEDDVVDGTVTFLADGVVAFELVLASSTAAVAAAACLGIATPDDWRDALAAEDFFADVLVALPGAPVATTEVLVAAASARAAAATAKRIIHGAFTETVARVVAGETPPTGDIYALLLAKHHGWFELPSSLEIRSGTVLPAVDGQCASFLSSASANACRSPGLSLGDLCFQFQFQERVNVKDTTWVGLHGVMLSTESDGDYDATRYALVRRTSMSVTKGKGTSFASSAPSLVQFRDVSAAPIDDASPIVAAPLGAAPLAAAGAAPVVGALELFAPQLFGGAPRSEAPAVAPRSKPAAPPKPPAAALVVAPQLSAPAQRRFGYGAPPQQWPGPSPRNGDMSLQQCPWNGGTFPQQPAAQQYAAHSGAPPSQWSVPSPRNGDMSLQQPRWNSGTFPQQPAAQQPPAAPPPALLPFRVAPPPVPPPVSPPSRFTPPPAPAPPKRRRTDA